MEDLFEKQETAKRIEETLDWLKLDCQDLEDKMTELIGDIKGLVEYIKEQKESQSET